MAIKKYKPTTPGRRGMTVTDYSVLSKVEPERSLLEPMKNPPAATTWAASPSAIMAAATARSTASLTLSATR